MYIYIYVSFVRPGVCVLALSSSSVLSSVRPVVRPAVVVRPLAVCPVVRPSSSGTSTSRSKCSH